MTTRESIILLAVGLLFMAIGKLLHIYKNSHKEPSVVTLTASATFAPCNPLCPNEAELRAIKKQLAETIAERIIEGGIAGLERDGDVFRLTVRCLAAEQY